MVLDEIWKGEDEVDACRCLGGRFLSDRPADFEALRNVMASLCRLVKGFFVKELEVKRFLFQFFYALDIQRVLDGSP